MGSIQLHIDGNDVAHGGLTTGTATYLGQGGTKAWSMQLTVWLRGTTLVLFSTQEKITTTGSIPELLTLVSLPEITRKS
jgi:hypothetical protein